MLTRRAALWMSSLCVACSSLSGRAQGDASFDGSDALVDASQPEDRAAPADRISPTSDASTCPRGNAPAFDSRAFAVLVEPAPHPLSSATLRSATIDAQGRVYALGYVESPPASRRVRAAAWRFTSATLSLDETWGDEGIAIDASVVGPTNYWIAGTIDEAGRLLVAGVSGDDAQGSLVLARYTVEGAPDETFGTAGRTVVAPRRVPGSVPAVRPFGIHHDAEGTTIAAGDAPPWHHPSSRGIALRFGPDGALDDTFGTAGVYSDSSLHGCFDVERDGDDHVFACISDDDRPALLRLDRAGVRSSAAAGGGVSVHSTAPRGFQARALERDSAGRWLVAGSVSPFFDDLTATPVAVRFLADGTPDLTWGSRGTAVALGVKHTFAYAYGQSFRLSCDDRLMFGAEVGTQPLVGAFDGDGRQVSISPEQYLRGPTRAGAYIVVGALLAVPGSADLVMVGNLNVAGAALARVLQ